MIKIRLSKGLRTQKTKGWTLQKAEKVRKK